MVRRHHGRPGAPWSRRGIWRRLRRWRGARRAERTSANCIWPRRRTSRRKAAIPRRCSTGWRRATSAPRPGTFDHRADGTIDKGPDLDVSRRSGPGLPVPGLPRGNSNFGDDPATGYNYNTTFVGAEGRFPTLDADGRLSRRMGSLSSRRAGGRPPTAIDDGTCSAMAAGSRARTSSCGRRRTAVEVDLGLVHGGTQAFRHGSCSNLVCLDGHVECCDTACEGVHRGRGFAARRSRIFREERLPERRRLRATTPAEPDELTPPRPFRRSSARLYHGRMGPPAVTTSGRTDASIRRSARSDRPRSERRPRLEGQVVVILAGDAVFGIEVELPAARQTAP